VSRAHSAKAPDDCARCCEIHAVLVDEHARRADETDVRSRSALPLTVAEIAHRIGLRNESMMRAHLAHLVAHGRLLADRRTPSGVPVGRVGRQSEPEWGPDQWAVNQQAPHAPCGDVVVVLGGIGWSGTMPMPEEMVGLLETRRLRPWSTRTLKTHRQCLGVRKPTDAADAVRAGLVLFVPQTTTLDDGRRVRRSDRFILLGGQIAEPLRDGQLAADLAASIFDQVPWWPAHAPKREGERARKAIGMRLLAGWPAAVLAAKLAPIPTDYVVNGYGLLAARLPAPGEPYRITARETVQGAALLMVTCDRCDKPPAFRGRPGDLCDSCREQTGDLAAVAGAGLATGGRVPSGRRPVLTPAF
jgi:hypothetical protein